MDLHSAEAASIVSKNQLSMKSDGMMTLKSSTSDVEVSSNDGTIRLDTRQASSEGETTQSDILVTAGGRAGMESSLNLLLKSSAETEIISSGASSLSSGRIMSVSAGSQDTTGGDMELSVSVGGSADSSSGGSIKIFTSSPHGATRQGEIAIASGKSASVEAGAHLRLTSSSDDGVSGSD